MNSSNSCDTAADLFPHVEPQVGRDLFVAAAPGVQLVANLTGHFHQALLDVVMNVLDGRIIVFRHTLAGDLVKREKRRRQLLLVQNASRLQRLGVRFARSDLVGQQYAIERKRPLPLLEIGVLRLAKAAGPHLHFAISAWTRARERAGSPRMRMKPSASFWL